MKGQARSSPDGSCDIRKLRRRSAMPLRCVSRRRRVVVWQPVVVGGWGYSFAECARQHTAGTHFSKSSMRHRQWRRQSHELHARGRTANGHHAKSLPLSRGQAGACPSATPCVLRHLAVAWPPIDKGHHPAESRWHTTLYFMSQAKPRPGRSLDTGVSCTGGINSSGTATSSTTKACRGDPDTIVQECEVRPFCFRSTVVSDQLGPLIPLDP